MSWDYTAPIGGEFFFPPSQRGQFGQDMVSRVLIGFLNITGNHMLHHNFFHSLVLPLAADLFPPLICNFFFPPSQRGQFGQDMASRVLIGFLNITGSHMLHHNFFHSLILPLAADFFPPLICNFCLADV